MVLSAPLQYEIVGKFGYISNEEVYKIVSFIKEHNEAYFDENIKKAIWSEPKSEDDMDTDAVGNGGSKNESEYPPDVIEAIKVALENDMEISISMLQRRLGFGWPRAAKAYDKLKVKGFISQPDNSKKCHLTISREEAERIITGEDDTGDSEE